MSTFQFDTSGFVWVPHGMLANTYWEDLTPFAQGYFTAMAREAWEKLSQVQKDRLDHFGPIAFSDFAPETLARGMRDCEAMASEIRPGSTVLTAEDGRRVWEHRQADFPGFNALDDRLRAKFPPLSLVIAEDGLLHSEERK